MTIPSLSHSKFPFDTIYGDHSEYVEHVFGNMRDLYKLPELEHVEDVSSEMFDYCRDRRHFILLVLYSPEKGVYLTRFVGDQLSWVLPGGSILSSETIHEAINRHAHSLSTGISLGEIEPIAVVRNAFACEEDAVEHLGLAVMVRVRNPQCITQQHPGRFVKLTSSEIEKVNRFANREALTLALERISARKLPVADNEIEASYSLGFRLKVHNLLVKRFILTDRRKRKAEINAKFDALVRDARTILDPSCGDSKFLEGLVSRNSNIELAVANDIAWETTSQIRVKHPHIIFTNHDAIYLPFGNDSFDVTICSNTLHHMASATLMKALLQRLFAVSKTLVLYEIRNPSQDRVFPKYLNRWYYHKFLRDEGVAYLGDIEFKSLVDKMFSGVADIEYDEISNVQGTYMLAIIKKRRAHHHEVEDKRIVSDADLNQLVGALKKNRFSKDSVSDEVDVYFSDVDGKLIKNRTCLRIRMDGAEDSATLDYKGPTPRRKRGSSFAKVESNLKLDKSDASAATRILEQLGFVPYVAVKKHRTTWVRVDRDRTQKVCIDRVDGAGHFAEFEVTAPESGESLGHLQENLKTLMAELGGDQLPPAELPYRDMVAQSRLSLINPRAAKVVLFDLDGTIVPTEQLFFDVWLAVSIKSFGAAFSFDEYVRHELEADGELFSVLQRDGRLAGSVVRNQYMGQVYKAYRRALRTRTRDGGFQGCFDPIIRLSKTHRIGLVTTSRREFVSSILESLDSEVGFEVIVSRGDVERKKPDPQAYLLALAKLEVAAVDVIAVEDSKRGAVAALNAGLHCVLIDNPALQLNGWQKELKLPLCKSLDELSLLLTSR